MRLLAHLLGAALLAVAGVAAVTWWALEASEVAVVTTGTGRETHVWFVEADDGLWLEAGTPENPWFLDLGAQAQPELRFEAEGRPALRMRAIPTPERSAEIRGRLRAKYGWRDRWVGQFVDATRSVAVRLEPVAE